MEHDPKPPRPRRDCPICGRPSREEAFPFCSTRCANVDLNRWLVGAYAIPAAEAEGDEDQSGES
jgi:endogenous inhibitor of DNA gyrase (YacG/DUF329 family)